MPTEPTEPTELGIVDGLVQLSFLVQSVLARTAARYELTVPQVRLLGILRDREPGMLQLARYLGLDKSSVTGLIDRAERRGLVQRAASADDGRAVRVSATALGRQLTDQASVEIAAEIQALSRTLRGADRRILASLVSQLVAAHQPEAASAPPPGR